jgi:hypothetical protein
VTLVGLVPVVGGGWVGGTWGGYGVTVFHWLPGDGVQSMFYGLNVGVSVFKSGVARACLPQRLAIIPIGLGPNRTMRPVNGSQCILNRHSHCFLTYLSLFLSQAGSRQRYGVAASQVFGFFFYILSAITSSLAILIINQLPLIPLQPMAMT